MITTKEYISTVYRIKSHLPSSLFQGLLPRNQEQELQHTYRQHGELFVECREFYVKCTQQGGLIFYFKILFYFFKVSAQSLSCHRSQKLCNVCINMIFANILAKTKSFAKLFCLFICGPAGVFLFKKCQQSCDTVPLIS